MSRVRIVQVSLIIAIFAGGFQCGLVLAQMSRDQASWFQLIAPAFASIVMAGLLLLAIIKPERFSR